ncbi:MAG: glycosyltransferase [Prevotellaceae bacterium]|jgi:glycosyltransferase involved in cell wall biosynthesis|nr:glycosyltransferase [Prevotellaceae bacterium]
MKKKVSIIIPVYNVESYLEECLQSVVNQTFQDMEIILIDDGSSDRSPDIMRMFAEQDDRIKIITQVNSGVSAARNRGLRAASGEYFLFIDSDDAILPNTVESLYRRAIKNQNDLLIGNVIYIRANGERSILFKRKEEIYNQTCISGEECYFKLMEDKMFPPLVYLFFMKRELIFKHKIFFKEGVIHEDELWCVKAMLSATKVSLIDFCYYNYFQRNGSLMNSNNKAFRMKSLFIVAKELNKIARKLKKENKTEVAGSIYMKIFGLFFFMNELSRQIEEITFEVHHYFSKLLKESYPTLSYSQQRECLMSYYFSNPQIQQKMTILSES